MYVCTHLKIEAIDAFRKKNEELFSNLLLVFKRVKNIIKSSKDTNLDESLLKEEAENLYTMFIKKN